MPVTSLGVFCLGHTHSDMHRWGGKCANIASFTSPEKRNAEEEGAKDLKTASTRTMPL